MATLILGSNTITHCTQVLMIAGKEVFRLRQMDDEGQLVADFEVCDAQGRQIARTIRNRIVQGDAGITVSHGPRMSEVLDATQHSLARVELLAADTVLLTGTFGIPGLVMEAAADALRMPAGGRISRCAFVGNGTAIEVQADGCIAFARTVAAPRPGFRVTSDVRALPQKQRRPK
jgi:hypothetical protein